MFERKQNILFLIILVISALYVFSSLKENWGTSPGTMTQLSSSSGYYPFSSYGFGYKYPQYMFKYPYRLYYPMGYIPERYVTLY